MGRRDMITLRSEPITPQTLSDREVREQRSVVAQRLQWKGLITEMDKGSNNSPHHQLAGLDELGKDGS